MIDQTAERCPKCGGRGVEDAHETGDGAGGPCHACGGGCTVPLPTLNDAITKTIVPEWQRHNSSLPTPDMIRFAYCTYFALIAAGLVKPVTAPDEIAPRIRLAVRSNPDSSARIIAIKAYRELAGSTLEAAKAWVDRHPEAWDLRIEPGWSLA